MPSQSQSRPAAIGIGTYRGAETASGDAEMHSALVAGILGGIRWIDTAINYRAQRSELVVGAFLKLASIQGVPRDALTVSTKAGFLPDAPDGSSYQELLNTVMPALGVNATREVTKSGHCVAPRYLRWSIERSLSNLDCSAVDVLYLHNPESQAEIADPQSLYARLALAFAELESQVSAGSIRAYGIATWNALRVSPSHPEHLDLARLMSLAKDVGGEQHHFRYVQAPINLLEPELITVASQAHEGRLRSSLTVANALGLHVTASSPLAAGRLRGRYRQAIDFVRTIPGIHTVLIGATREQHGVDAAGRHGAPTLTPRAWRTMLASIAAVERT